jgi:hypothetical protein
MKREDITPPLPTIEELEESLKAAKELECSIRSKLSEAIVESNRLKCLILHITTPYKIGAEVVYGKKKYVVDQYVIRHSQALPLLRNIKNNGELGEIYTELPEYKFRLVQLIKEGTL